jgi:hypothetical protein
MPDDDPQLATKAEAAISKVELMSASWGGSGFLAGFLLITGIQIFFWVIGIRSELLGNVTDDVFDWQGEEETSRHTSTAIQR